MFNCVALLVALAGTVLAQTVVPTLLNTTNATPGLGDVFTVCTSVSETIGLDTTGPVSSLLTFPRCLSPDYISLVLSSENTALQISLNQIYVFPDGPRTVYLLISGNGTVTQCLSVKNNCPGVSQTVEQCVDGVCIQLTITPDVGPTVGDRVWFDNNSDGLQDPDEVGVGQKRVYVKASDGTTILAETLTDDHGTYLFDTAFISDPLTASVCIETEGAVASPVGAGVDPAIDSDGVVIGTESCAEIDGISNNIDFGLVDTSGAICIPGTERVVGAHGSDNPAIAPNTTTNIVWPAENIDPVVVPDVGGQGIALELTINDPFLRNANILTSELRNNTNITSLLNWDSYFPTQTDGVYGPGVMTLCMSSLYEHEYVELVYAFSSPVILSSFAIDDIDGSGSNAAFNGEPHDSFQDEIDVQVSLAGIFLDAVTARPAVNNSAVNITSPTSYAGEYIGGVNSNLSPIDPRGRVLLRTDTAVDTIRLRYSNGPGELAFEPNATLLATYNGLLPLDANSVSNNHCVRLTDLYACKGKADVCAEVRLDSATGYVDPPAGFLRMYQIETGMLVVEKRIDTGDTGNIAFDSVLPGKWRFCFTPDQSELYFVSSEQPADEITEGCIMLLVTGEEVEDGCPIQFSLRQLVSFGDYVWFDGDRDGVQLTSSRETSLPDAVVSLVDQNTQAIVASTATDLSGYYLFSSAMFSGVYPGQPYQIQIDLPPDTEPVVPDASPNDLIDSDAVLVEGVLQINMTSPLDATPVLSYDFGIMSALPATEVSTPPFVVRR